MNKYLSKLIPGHGYWNRVRYSYNSSPCMPSPLAPDPIRVQSCVCCLFWTNRNSLAVTYLSIYLIIQLELWILVSALSVNGNIYFYWNYDDVANRTHKHHCTLTPLYTNTKKNTFWTIEWLSVTLTFDYNQ